MIEWTEHEFVEEGAQCAKENGGEVHGQKVVDGWKGARSIPSTQFGVCKEGEEKGNQSSQHQLLPYFDKERNI